MPKWRGSDQKGRSKGRERFVCHFFWQVNSDAWKSLSLTARCLEMELKAIYNGMNNGQLFLSVREAGKRLGVSPNTAMKAFRELEERGFIKPKQKGSFHLKARHATTWILTEFEYNNQLATREFMRWKNPVAEINTDSINFCDRPMKGNEESPPHSLISCDPSLGCPVDDGLKF